MFRSLLFAAFVLIAFRVLLLAAFANRVNISDTAAVVTPARRPTDCVTLPACNITSPTPCFVALLADSTNAALAFNVEFAIRAEAFPVDFTSFALVFNVEFTIRAEAFPVDFTSFALVLNAEFAILAVALPADSATDATVLNPACAIRLVELDAEETTLRLFVVSLVPVSIAATPIFPVEFTAFIAILVACASASPTIFTA